MIIDSSLLYIELESKVLLCAICVAGIVLLYKIIFGKGTKK